MSKISVLQISHFDNAGGSGRSAYKIHRGLRELGFDSKMLVRTRVTQDEDVRLIRTGWMKLADKAVSILTESTGLQYLYLPSTRRLLSHPWYKKADIVQLNCIHGKYFSQSTLPAICREKHVVWRLSDMWPMTGHCAQSGDCDKWKTGCRGCPHLSAFPSLKWDTASLLWKLKERRYQRCNFHLVAPSRWMCDQAEQSPLLARFPKTIIRNGVDCELFKPMDQQQCRRLLNIPHQGKAILFIAQNVKDGHKGVEMFLQAIRQLWKFGERDFFVMFVGSNASHYKTSLPCPVWSHDGIREDDSLALVYNSADIIVHPALRENLPNSLMEAMACGCPAVAFAAGGIPELIRQGEEGVLAPIGNMDKLVDGMDWVLKDHPPRRELSQKCRRKIQREYSIERQARSFAELFESIVGLDGRCAKDGSRQVSTVRQSGHSHGYDLASVGEASVR